jgi:3-oxoacyl-[acyl-carrier-protein] synthase-1
MSAVYVQNWNAFTPLGSDIGSMFDAMRENRSAVKPAGDLFPEQAWASLFTDDSFVIPGFSRLESMVIRALAPMLPEEVAVSPRTIFIFSSTKGNIDCISSGKPLPQEAFLWHTAEKITRRFGNPNKPVTVSTACVSGIVAQNAGYDLIRSGRYDHAVVFGADLVTPFVVSGFGSFKALSAGPCRPYDADRDGINLGEGAGALLFGKTPGNFPVRLTGTGCSNDANHISGPSRSGEGLYLAIRQALRESGIKPEQIDFLGAHGTATPYNDEMESLAFFDSGLSGVPVNSLKGYIGHTLGAAGLIESAVLLETMRRGDLIASKGYENHGVSRGLNIIRRGIKKPVLKALKTGSGFGGSNAATLFEAD